MRVVGSFINRYLVEADLDDGALEDLILSAIAAQANVSVTRLREHGRLTFELSDAGTPEQPRWSARFVAEIPLPVGEGR